MPQCRLIVLATLCVMILPQHLNFAQTGSAASGQTRDRMNLDFPGGTVVQYINAIRELVPEANFVIMPGAETFQMPEMQLRNVSVENLATLIDHVSAPPNGQSGISVSNLGQMYAVRVRLGDAPADAKVEQMVFSLDEVVGDDISAEDVLTSIETALELFGDEFPPAQVRYHDATKLLIARGHQLQVIHIMTVIEQLRDAKKESMAMQLEVLTAERRQLQEVLTVREQEIMTLHRDTEQLLLKIASLERALADCLAQKSR